MTMQLRPTFSESWYRVKDLRVRLRPSAQISRQFYRGDRWYVVRDPASNQFHRLSDAAYRFVGLLDGTLTVGEAWEVVGGQMADDAPTQPEVIQILTQLYAANLIETNVTPDAQVLLRRHKKQQQKKLQGRLMNLLFPRIPLWDPDTFLKRWMPAVGPILSVGGMLVWLGVVVFALALILPQTDRLAAGAGNLFQNPDPMVWVLLGLSFIVTKFIHEMGHAFSCRRFGGECHEVGIMFLVLFPCPYVDASTAWAFPSKWRRIFVGAAGMIAELFVAAVAAIIWTFTDDLSLISQICYNVMLIAGISTVVFNANPLLRYDGYYILSDYLEIPNLQNKSREYTLGLFRRHLFRVKETRPLPPKPQRWQLVLFSVTSTIYRIFIGFAIMLMVFYQLPEWARPVGLIMGIGAAVTFFVVPIFKLGKYLLTDPELHRKRARAWAYTLAGASAVAILVALIEFPTHLRADAVVEPGEREYVRAATPGEVERVLVRSGELVEPGQELVRLDNPDVEAELTEAEIEYDTALAGYQAAAAEEPAARRVAQVRLAYADRRLDLAEQRYAELSVRAEGGGRFVAPDLETLPGRYLRTGDQIGRIDRSETFEAIAYVGQDQIELLRRAEDEGGAAEVRLAGLPGTVLPVRDWSPPGDGASVRQVRSPLFTLAGGGQFTPDPSDETGRRVREDVYEVSFEIAAPEGMEIVPGQRSYVRLDSGSEPLLTQGWRKLLQIIQSQSNPQDPL